MKKTTMNWLGKNMEKTLTAMLFAAAMLVMAIPTSAQVSVDDVKEAVDIIKGKSIHKTTEWAVQILREVEDPEMKPMAENTLAIAYLNGIGVAQDSVQAVRYFEAAAQCGYINAYHNLGMIMKNASYGRQDFKKAVSYFEKGAAAGSLMCSYDAGYMYYKGLGCRQDYSCAVEYFKRGIDSGNPSCLYMLGLCYRNGFGVGMDEEMAAAYLKKASLANYRFAIEETLREGAEVQPSVKLSEDGNAAPESMPDVEAFLNKTTDLGGSYTGILVTYDWSGKQVVKEQNLSIDFTGATDSYCGMWVQDADTLAFYARIEDDGTLRFDNTRILMKDRYTEGSKVEYLFDNASLALLGGSLTGGLRLYSVTQKEPQRPIYISLNRRTDDPASIDRHKCAMAAFPVAGTNQIEVRFTLPENVQDATLYLTTQNGVFAKNFNLGALTAGEQRFTVSTNLNDGLYIVSMKADGLHGQTAMMLKR